VVLLAVLAGGQLLGVSGIDRDDSIRDWSQELVAIDLAERKKQNAPNDESVPSEQLQHPSAGSQHPPPVRDSRNFVSVQLPRNVSIQLPKNWLVLSGNQRITLDSAVESRLDLSGIRSDGSIFPFAANLLDEAGKTIGMVNVRFYPDLAITQDDVKTALPSDIADLDMELRNQLQASMAAISPNLILWEGTRLVERNGIATFVSEYTRSSALASGHFRVRLVRVFAAERSFTLTVSYYEPAGHLLKPIADRIISSLRMDTSEAHDANN
jgi:hypothetical protein